MAWFFIVCLNRFESRGQSVLIKKTFISAVDSDIKLDCNRFGLINFNVYITEVVQMLFYLYWHLYQSDMCYNRDREQV